MAGALTGLILFWESWQFRVEAVLYGLGYGGSIAFWLRPSRKSREWQGLVDRSAG